MQIMKSLSIVIYYLRTFRTQFPVCLSHNVNNPTTHLEQKLLNSVNLQLTRSILTRNHAKVYFKGRHGGSLYPLFEHAC